MTTAECLFSCGGNYSISAREARVRSGQWICARCEVVRMPEMNRERRAAASGEVVYAVKLKFMGLKCRHDGGDM